MFRDGMKVICPNSWEDSAVKDQYAIFGSPNFGDTFGNALSRFLKDYGNTKRYIQPPPWNPGNKVLDLYDLFSTSASTGNDNHLEPTGSVGRVVRKSVFSQVSGNIEYKIKLPAVTGDERLNFWTSLGIKDGAGSSGGETTFQASINGHNLFGPGLHLHKNYWSWKRWIPMMVDVTFWAGQEVTLTLTTLGNEFYGWTTWGAPAIYVTASGNDLARDKRVTVSSSDSSGDGRWDPSFLTDGNVDSGLGGRFGWTSVLHSSPIATEWAQIDLGSSHSIGKVVLFPRSDILEARGSGFPIDFKIQGSADGLNWTDLLVESDYPGAQSGEGQIFVFVAAKARFVRVIATKLGGVGGEAGYRFQLADIQVYA
jgi:hypothetical protein